MCFFVCFTQKKCNCIFLRSLNMRQFSTVSAYGCTTTYIIISSDLKWLVATEKEFDWVPSELNCGYTAVNFNQFLLKIQFYGSIEFSVK